MKAVCLFIFTLVYWPLITQVNSATNQSNFFVSHFITGNPAIPFGAGSGHIRQESVNVSLVSKKPCTLPSHCCRAIEKRGWKHQQVIKYDVHGFISFGCNWSSTGRVPVLGTGRMFSRAWHRWQVSRAWNRLHIFPRLVPVAYFPALGTGYMFSRASHRLLVFPRLASVTCFPALGTGGMFSRVWHQWHIFPRLHVFLRSSWLGTCCIFSRMWNHAVWFIIEWADLITSNLVHPKTAIIACSHVFLLFSVAFHSKKDSEQRQKELLEGISPALLELVKENAQQLMFDKGGCQLVLATLLKCEGESEVRS